MSDDANNGRMNDDDIVTVTSGASGGARESVEDRDTGGHGNQDTGDEPTERDDDRDVGGEGNQDTGDES